MQTRVALIVGCTLCLGVGLPLAHAEYVYWTNSTGQPKAILRHDLVYGSGTPQTFHTPTAPPGGAGPHGLGLDSVNGHWFWSAGPYIGRIGTNGSGAAHDFINRSSETDEVREIDVNPAGGKIYWTEKSTSGGSQGRIMQADLNGTIPSIQTLVPGDTARRPFGLDIDPVNGWVYWTSFADSYPTIWRTDFSGNTQATPLVNYYSSTYTGPLPIGISLNVAGNTMYWTEGRDPSDGAGRIMKAALDGSSPTVVYDPTTPFNPYGIVVDPITDLLYFTVIDNPNAVFRIGGDGSGLTQIVFDPGQMDFPAFIEFDATASVIPEPSSLALLGFGGLVLFFRRRARQR